MGTDAATTNHGRIDTEGKLRALRRVEKEKAWFKSVLTVFAIAIFGAILFKQVVLGFVLIAVAVPVTIFGLMTIGDFKRAYFEYWQATGLSSKEASEKYYNEFPPAD